MGRGPVPPAVNPETLRADIPALADGTVYLNTGASGPAPNRVLAAARDAQREQEVDHHRGNPYPEAWDAYDESRAAVAGLLGTDPETVALTNSTADGISRVVNAVEWERGDAVVRTDLEHPAGVLPFERLAGDGVEVREVAAPAGRLDRDAYADAVADAAFVCLSSLSWLHGTRLPVRDAVELAHDAGAFVLVDAVQSVGHHPVDVESWGADAVAAAGHKWLLGVWGAGFLYVSPDVVGDLRPRHLGYRSVPKGTDGLEFEPGTARFEVGTQSLAPHAALREAIEIRSAVGADTVSDRIGTLADRLVAGFGDRVVSPRPPESGLVVFEDPTPEATVDRLADAGIHVRTVPGDRIRASVHVFNDESDVDALLAALDEPNGAA
jgi:cysteine desulfurase/selenocysteine lyase